MSGPVDRELNAQILAAFSQPESHAALLEAAESAESLAADATERARSLRELARRVGACDRVVSGVALTVM